MHKLHLILKTSKSHWLDFMRAVQYLRILMNVDGEQRSMLRGKRQNESRMRERKGKNNTLSSSTE